MVLQLTLSDISPKETIIKCYFYTSQKGDKKHTQNEPVISPLDSLLCQYSEKYCLFTDSFQKENKLWMNMIQYNADGISAMPKITNLPCWYCRKKFKTHPLGIPLKYHCEKNMNENMKKRIREILKKQNLPTTDISFFEVEGNLCSFCCIESYVQDHVKTCSRYKKSSTLNCLMYQKCKGVLSSIPLAPLWKLRKEYGGHLTDEQYEACIGHMFFLETVNLKRPLMYCCQSYIDERKIKNV